MVFGEARDFDDLVEPLRPDMLAGELASVVTKGAPSALALVFASRGDDVDHGERSVVGQFEGWAMARVTGWTCCSRSSGIRLISAGAASRVGSSPNVAESGTKYLSPTVKRTGPLPSTQTISGPGQVASGSPLISHLSFKSLWTGCEQNRVTSSRRPMGPMTTYGDAWRAFFRSIETDRLGIRTCRGYPRRNTGSAST